MIKNRDKLRRFYRDLIKREKLPFDEALRVYEQLHAEAVSLGAISSETIMNGIEVDIRIAKALRNVTRCAR